MSMYFLDTGSAPPSLDGALRSLIANQPCWHLRQMPDERAEPITLQWIAPSLPHFRRAEVREVAEALVADPRVEAALQAMDSPVAEHIEYAVASQYLPPVDAKLLTDALHLALKYVTDRSKPLWKRADVLISVGVALVFVVVVVVVARHVGGHAPTA